LRVFRSFKRPQSSGCSVEDPDAATHRGRVAVRRYIEGYMEMFPGLRADLEECVEAPGDRVLATIRYTGRARASGMDGLEAVARLPRSRTA